MHHDGGGGGRSRSERLVHVHMNGRVSQIGPLPLMGNIASSMPAPPLRIGPPNHYIVPPYRTTIQFQSSRIVCTFLLINVVPAIATPPEAPLMQQQYHRTTPHYAAPPEPHDRGGGSGGAGDMAHSKTKDRETDRGTEGRTVG